MDTVTTEDRRKELKVLLQQMQDQPSRDWTAERERAAVLTQMIAASETGSQSAQQQG